MTGKNLIGIMIVIFGLSGCEDQTPVPQEIAAITTERLLAQEKEPDVWLTGGRDYKQSYHSPLRDIHKGNIKKLGFAWQYKTHSTHGFQATPIVVDGVMFASGPKGAVYALDARTGAERWLFAPDIDNSVMRRICCGPVNRGVAVWDGAVYVASLDGYLYALNADNGAVIWKVDTITERDRGYAITGAPYIAGNKVIIGNAGAELDARGYITAYDVKTGEQKWRFFTVPGSPDGPFEHPELAMAAKTWDRDSLWPVGLGGTVWDGMAYDPVLDLLYIGTGNGAPHPRTLRSPKGGDNLFLASILAINPNNGRLVWHYQTTPADNWDYTAVQKMILADIPFQGQKRKVIMQAPKNGFFYVLDRLTGELLSAEPYVTVTWASHVDKTSGRPVETGQGDYDAAPKLVFPSWYGGHNWQPMSHDPQSGLVYIPTMEMPVVFTRPKAAFAYQKGGFNANLKGIFPIPGPLGLGAEKDLPDIEQLTKNQPDITIRGHLKAYDPVQQKIIWQQETSGPWTGHPAAIWNGGGVMTTASGLIFQGRATGDLVISDSKTGQELHRIAVGTGLMAAPMTYRIDGIQYVAIMAGVGGSLGRLHASGSAAEKYGNEGRIIVFTLNGGPVPIPPEVVKQPDSFPMPPVPETAPIEETAAGQALFQRHCSACHKNLGGTGIPDLRQMNEQTHAEFLDIVLEGSRAEQGMGSFKEILSTAEAEAIHAHLIAIAWQAYREKQKPINPHKPDNAD